MLETLDAAAVRRWCGGGLSALRAHQREIDELNVYPVPDGDTGTNLVLTLTSAQEALEAAEAEFAGAVEQPRPPANALRRMARGALLGARGNSGVIVSQILRGMADSLAASVAVRGADLARALRSASEAAYAAVARPVEGTVLSVVAAAADAAGRLKSDDLVAVARAAAFAAAEALARTPQQLPALARAGVVDAGGRGLVVLLDALVEALTLADARRPGDQKGHEPSDQKSSDQKSHEPSDQKSSDQKSSDQQSQEADDPRSGRPGEPKSHDSGTPRDPSSVGHKERTENGHAEDSAKGEAQPEQDGHHGEGAYGYEVQYLLDAEAEAVTRLRRELAALGDSLAVVGSGDPGLATWNVHVHVPAGGIGPAVEAGVVAGRPHRITVTPLDPRGHEHPTGRGAVVVAAGDGLTALFEAEGATVVGRNPSTAEMLDAIERSGARCVVLLPNDANTHAVAVEAAKEAGESGRQVSVVPTRSPVQALAALAVRDPGRPFADDVIAMAEAAGACRYGEVCTAQRDSLTVAGPCRAGDLLGLVDGEVHVIGDDLAQVSAYLLDRMLGGGGELATLVLGADAPAELEPALRAHVAAGWPFVELECYAGGQPRYHLLVGVE
ncbi:DAK2 domain-containing protein [Paractinoplanes lichenicola]|uniref:DAK2 domain-containing protein n=1 Tax=Paractinoplanes lichenicola TaxID=2802976 RepID=A0ABS1VKP5_9ACTN|nr:DAK2 domain-containing protein [Actinoplanes lichenicola]MBL7255295.1 DAK2 domain-containing protein [Actinoplanes lichenicola]